MIFLFNPEDGMKTARSLDPELKTMHLIDRKLRAIPDDARCRVLEWLQGRLNNGHYDDAAEVARKALEAQK